MGSEAVNVSAWASEENMATVSKIALVMATSRRQ